MSMDLNVPDADRPSRGPPRTVPDPAIPRVLLVDPDSAMTSLLSGVFRRHGHHLDAVASVADANALLDKDEHDAVLLELNLPDGNGFELLRELRSVRHRTFPVVVVSAIRQPGAIARCLQLGATRYLTKPVDPIELLRAVARPI